MAKLVSIYKALTRRSSTPFYDVALSDDSERRAVLDELDRVLCLTEPEELVELVSAFEKEFAVRFGAQFAIGVNSGTSALYFALRAVGIGPGDEVITVGNTFITTITAIVQTGATLVFADIDRATGMMDVGTLNDVVSSKTKAVIPVHMYGNMVDMAALTEFARRHGIAVIEDSCQAIGARMHDKFAGTWGDVGCFSFHANKLVGAPGDGGILVTRNKSIRDAVRKLAEPDWKVALDTVQNQVPSRLAALLVPVLRTKLSRLDDLIEFRTAQYARYWKGLSDQDHVRLLMPTQNVTASHRNIIVVVDNSTAAMRRLLFAGIPYRRIYLGSAAILRAINERGRYLPEAERLVNDHIALPVGEHIDNDIVDHAIELLRKT